MVASRPTGTSLRRGGETTDIEVARGGRSTNDRGGRRLSSLASLRDIPGARNCYTQILYRRVFVHSASAVLYLFFFIAPIGGFAREALRPALQAIRSGENRPRVIYEPLWEE